jgi:hypothetical protein
MLYRSTDRLCRCGASVESPAHSASFHSREKTAPSKPRGKPAGASGCPAVPLYRSVSIPTPANSASRALPPTTDRPWNWAVVDASKVGRNIRCFRMGDMPPDDAAAKWQLAHSGWRVADGSILIRADALRADPLLRKSVLRSARKCRSDRQ